MSLGSKRGHKLAIVASWPFSSVFGGFRGELGLYQRVSRGKP